MIKKLKLKNFRNFDDSQFFFDEKINAIIWENGKWKTNILEAISLLHLSNISKIDFDNLVKFNKEVLYIEIEDILWNNISLSYEKTSKKKIYKYNWKKVAKKKLFSKIEKIVFFSPIMMNIMYLSPNLRRDFLDDILIRVFENYKEILSKYKKILSSRNKILKNIREWNSQKTELEFWDKQFVKQASIIYNYRIWITNFFKENISTFDVYFENKISSINFEYKTKILNNKKLNKKEKIEYIQKQILENLEKNLKKDIIIWSTSMWPHNDDFEIYVNKISLVEFASRWEVKSVIIWMKLLEISFIEQFLKQKPILVIDDLLSEIDEKHKNIILKSIKWYQTFISSIRKDYEKNINIILL